LYLCPKEMAILKSKEVLDIRYKYQEVIGEISPGFNYDEFDSIEDYIRILKECIETKRRWYNENP
jgi:hypothetical protein